MNVGGPALQIVGLEQGLEDLGFECRLVAGAVDGSEEDLLSLRASHVRVEALPDLGRRISPFSDFKALVGLIGHVRRFRPHIVHTHMAKAGVLGRFAAWLLGVPVVVHTFHGHLLRGYFPPRKTRLVVSAERLLARITTVLASVGARVRDELLSTGVGVPEQYVVVPPGVPPPRSVPRAEARHRLDLPDLTPVVAFVGRLAPVKRFDRFVEMAGLLVEAGHDVHFLVVGGGEVEAARETARLLGDRVTFTGWLADIGLAYGAADVVVCTSDNEGMPVSLIEAQMCGVPVVTADVGSAGEVVEPGATGFVIEASGPALASSVGAILDSAPLRDALGRRAGEWAIEAFSVERLVADTAELYRSALSRAGRGSR
jgi:glycosyltransferase involved in cell wall biosynthesis